MHIGYNEDICYIQYIYIYINIYIYATTSKYHQHIVYEHMCVMCIYSLLIYILIYLYIYIYIYNLFKYNNAIRTDIILMITITLNHMISLQHIQHIYVYIVYVMYIVHYVRYTRDHVLLCY